MKFYKNDDLHVQMHSLTLKFSKWLPLAWQWGDEGAIRYCQQLQIQLWHPKRSLGDILLFYVSFCFYFYYYFSSTHFCPVWNSNVNGPKKMVLYHNVNHQMKICFLGLALSRWLPLPWKRNKCEKIQFFVLVNCLDML